MEIKFRLYNKRDQKMYRFDPCWGNFGQGDGWVGAIPFEDERVTYAPSNRVQLEPESCDWMPFIGLEDKNGTEIYEGDYGKDEAGNICRIFWNDNSCGFDADFPNADMFSVAEVANNIEVIGNIYENKELLNGNNINRE